MPAFHRLSKSVNLEYNFFSDCLIITTTVRIISCNNYVPLRSTAARRLAQKAPPEPFAGFQPSLPRFRYRSSRFPRRSFHSLLSPGATSCPSQRYRKTSLKKHVIANEARQSTQMLKFSHRNTFFLNIMGNFSAFSPFWGPFFKFLYFFF